MNHSGGCAGLHEPGRTASVHDIKLEEKLSPDNVLVQRETKSAGSITGSCMHGSKFLSSSPKIFLASGLTNWMGSLGESVRLKPNETSSRCFTKPGVFNSTSERKHRWVVEIRSCGDDPSQSAEAMRSARRSRNQQSRGAEPRPSQSSGSTQILGCFTSPLQAPVSRPRDSIKSLNRSRSPATRADTAPTASPTFSTAPSGS